MKDFYCRAKIKTDRIWSNGFINISKEGVIQGLFALDYVRIELDGKEMSLILKELQVNTLPGGFFITKEKQSIYTSKYKYSQLESPKNYALSDASGSILTLKLEDAIDDPITISAFIHDIENYKS